MWNWPRRFHPGLWMPNKSRDVGLERRRTIFRHSCLAANSASGDCRRSASAMNPRVPSITIPGSRCLSAPGHCRHTGTPLTSLRIILPGTDGRSGHRDQQCQGSEDGGESESRFCRQHRVVGDTYYEKERCGLIFSGKYRGLKLDFCPFCHYYAWRWFSRGSRPPGRICWIRRITTIRI